MTELVSKINWRWITGDRRFFTLYRGWRCCVWQSGQSWEYSADYRYAGVSRGTYGWTETQAQAEKAALDSVDREMSVMREVTE